MRGFAYIILGKLWWGYGNPNSYIEYSKHFIDDIHARYSMSNELKESDNTRMMHSLHYYDSMLVIEKREMYPSVTIKTGGRL